MFRNKWFLWFILGLCTQLVAKDFPLKILPQATAPNYDLSDLAGKKTYYEFMHSTLGKKMQDEAVDPKHHSTNEVVLKAGGGISVKLSKKNYNVHINYPNAAEGGRSYGWTTGQVGDWSDRVYLEHLGDISTKDEDTELAKFYSLLIQMLGASNADDKTLSIEDLSNPTQRVASNFLAIYTAEQFRAMVPKPHMNWDDALFQVTMLAAFHGGQTTFTKYYINEFSELSKVQAPGVYGKDKKNLPIKGVKYDDADEKRAEMNDYWQFSPNPNSTQSGVNETRHDFQLMGAAITAYVKGPGKNKFVARIEKVVGESDNIIQAISKHYTTGKATVAETDAFAKVVSDFLISIKDDADRITEYTTAQEKKKNKE